MMVESSKISKKVSLAIRIFNDYNLSGIHKAEILLDGLTRKKITKDGGYNVFINLEKEEYDVEINSAGFIKKNINIDMKEIDQLNPIVNVRMKPKYETLDEETGVIVKFTCEYGEKKQFKAYLVDSAIGELIESTKRGANKIKLENFFGDVLFGDAFKFDDEEKSEIFEVFKFDGDTCLIDGKFKYAHKEGTKIRRAFISELDTKGKGVFYFKNLIKKKNKINLLIDDKEEEVTVNIDGYNKLINLGKI